MRWLESTFADKARAWVGFNELVSHRITAAADMLLMPSRFEPCGLNQLYAMRCAARCVPSFRLACEFSVTCHARCDMEVCVRRLLPPLQKSADSAQTQSSLQPMTHFSLSFSCTSGLHHA